jgi:hypothetical protein
VQTSRLFVFFHSSKPARKTAAAALAFCLTAVYATCGSVWALSPVSKADELPPSDNFKRFFFKEFNKKIVFDADENGQSRQA